MKKIDFKKILSIFKNQGGYIGPKGTYKKKLTYQSLIFLIMAVIIIIVLVFSATKFVSFLTGKINQSFKIDKNSNSGITTFNLKALEELKEKIRPVEILSPSIIPTTTPTVQPSASTTPIIKPIVSVSPKP